MPSVKSRKNYVINSEYFFWIRDNAIQRYPILFSIYTLIYSQYLVLLIIVLLVSTFDVVGYF